jgi:hypothetical protein
VQSGSPLDFDGIAQRLNRWSVLQTRSGGLQTAEPKTTAVCKPPLLEKAIDQLQISFASRKFARKAKPELDLLMATEVPVIDAEALRARVRELRRFL